MPSPARVAYRYLTADEADTGYGAMLDGLRELAKGGVATDYGDQKFLLKRLKTGDRVEIHWSPGSSSPMKKQVYFVSMDWKDYNESLKEQGMSPSSEVKVLLEPNRQSRSGGGTIMDYGTKYGVVWQPSMLTQVRRVLGLKKV